MNTILVSGASGVVGYGALRSLRQTPSRYKLIGSTIYDDSIAPAFCDIFEQAPLSSDEGYIDWLRKVIEKHAIDMIIPGIEDDMFVWNNHREELTKSGTLPLLNNPELITLCSDKWDFYTKLKTQGMEVLIDSRLEGTFDELSASLGLPFLLKPRRGYASKGIVIIDSEELFEQHRHALGTKLMAQPIVGNKDAEYTVSAFFDKASNLCCYMSLRRKLSAQGFTDRAEVATPPGTKAIIRKLGDLLKPIGPTNFQFRLHQGHLKLLEVNPRISSATSIRSAFGYNENVMAADYFLKGIVPTQPAIRYGYAVRYIEDYIFYDSNPV